MFIINPYIYGVAFTGLLDTYTGAKLAFSLRRLSGSYSGSLIRVREDGTNTETDIGFDSNGDLDTAAIASHCGANNGYIVKWYDQSGNANDLSQATAANQHQIYNGSVTLTDPNNGNVAALSDGTDDWYSLGTSFASTQPIFYMQVFNRASTGIWNSGIGSNVSSGSQPSAFLWSSGDDIYTRWGTALLAHENNNFSTGDFIVTVAADASNNKKLWLNGTAKTPLTGATTATTVGGGLQYAGNEHNGYVQEFILWESDLEASESGIRGNANTYWGVY